MTRILDGGANLVPQDVYGIRHEPIVVPDLNPTTIASAVRGLPSENTDTIIAEALGASQEQGSRRRLTIIPDGEVASDLIGAASAARNFTTASDLISLARRRGVEPSVVITRGNRALVFNDPREFMVVPTGRQLPTPRRGGVR